MTAVLRNRSWSVRLRTFRLSTLLVGVSSLCILLGVVVVPAERRRATVRMIERRGWFVAYSGEGIFDATDRGDRQPYGEDNGAWRVYWDPVTAVYVDEETCTDEELRQITTLDEIQSLELSGGEVTSAGLQNLDNCRNLRGLYLCNTNVDSRGMTFVGRCRNLEFLDISCTHVDDEGMAPLSSLTELRCLYLPAAVTSKGLGNLAPLRKLEYLAVVSSQFDDDGFEEPGTSGIDDDGMLIVGSFIFLRELDLAESHVTDGGVRHLSKLKQLEEIDLHLLPGVTAESFRILAKLPKLRRVDVSDTSVDDSVLPWLAQMVDLERLGLSGSRVTSEGIEEVKRLLPKCRVTF